MLCVECKNPDIECLYYKYKSEYIKLAICPKCSNVVDKYIEYDNVLLFIDVLLLKPQAYRHLSFNVTELEMTKDPIVKSDYNSDPTPKEKRSSFKDKLHRVNVRFGKLLRVILMIILFEVYLTWAYQEKKSHHTKVMSFILQSDSYFQYGWFILILVLKHLFFNIFLQFIFFNTSHWSNIPVNNINPKYHKSYYIAVLLTTVLVSNSIKLIPILMLIWPYDKTLQSSQIVNLLATLNVIEALRITSGNSYSRILTTFLVAKIMESIICNGIICCLVSYLSGLNAWDLFLGEYQEGISIGLKYITLFIGLTT